MLKKIGFLLFSALLLGTGTNGNPVLGADRQVSLVLLWEPQSQFAGYYMALEKGFYKQRSLDVTIIPGGADVDAFSYLQTGAADFCTAMISPALHLQAAGHLDLVMLKQVMNRSNFALVAWKKGRNGDSLIETPSDLADRKISVWEGFREPYLHFLSQHQVDPEIIPQYYTVSLFMHRGVDACSAMIFNEYHTLIQNGIPQEELTVFKLHEYGTNLPEDGLYTLRETFESEPLLCENFAEASMEGWEYARRNPEETLKVVMKYVEAEKLPTNPAHMRWMLDTILQSIFPEDQGAWAPGTISRKRFQEAVEMLMLQEEAPPYEQFVTAGARDGISD